MIYNILGGDAGDGFRLSEYFYSNRIRLCSNMKNPQKLLLNRLNENHLCKVVDDFELELSTLLFEINQMAFRSGKEVPGKLSYNPIRSLPYPFEK